MTSYVSKPERNRATGTWTIYLARKLTAPDGEFLGLVAGAMELAYFEKFFGSIALRPDGAISLFRRDGLLLARYPQRDLPGTSYAQGALFKTVLTHANQGVVRLSSIVDGEERLIAGHSLAHYPVVVAVGTTVAAALADWRRWAIYLIGAAALTIIMIAGIIVLSVRQFKNYELLVQARAEKAEAEKLREKKLQLDTALNNMRHGLLLFDSESRLALCNQRYLKMYGLSPETTTPGCTLRDLLCQRKAVGTFKGDPDQYMAKLVDHGQVESKVVQLPDGRMISVTNAPAPDGGWVSTHEDVTEQRRAEMERDRSQKFLNTIIENVPAPIFVKEASGLRYVLVNRAGENFWGVSRAKIIGKTSYEIFAKEEADLIAARDEQLLQSDQPFFDEREIRTPCNGVRSIVSKRLVVSDDDGKSRYVIGVIEDVTERKRAEERIAHLAHYDALTNLPNRILLCGRLEQELSHVRRGGQLAVLYLDLDYFKSVNDTLGHSTGDELLKAVAGRLRGCLRDIDIIARLGGDEFAIVQTALEQPTDAAILAQRIRDEMIQAPYELNGNQVVIDVSVGIALAPNDGTDVDQLLKSADMALYGAKADGRGTYRYFEPEMDARMKTRRALEVDLRRALANGEFELYYQPLVSLQSNEVSGCEALLRWHHPERGLISPAEFIPVAEDTGLIIPIGEWVLRQACTHAAAWPDDIKVAVNISPVQFRNQTLAQIVVSTLAASGLPPHRLELEITESVLMQNNEATLRTLHQLRELGVRIAMDDFGTGYSSPSYLRSFPFSKIKIDRSFISDLSNSADSLKIVQAVAGLAGALNMITTAEGVETDRQREIVCAAGCTEMQGYLYSRPRPLEEILRLVMPRAESAESAA